MGEGPRASKPVSTYSPCLLPILKKTGHSLALASNLSKAGSLGPWATPHPLALASGVLWRKLGVVLSPLSHHFQPTQSLAPRRLPSGGEGPVLHPTPTLSCFLTSPDPEQKPTSPGWLLLHALQGPIHSVPRPQVHILEFLQLPSQSTAKGTGKERESVCTQCLCMFGEEKACVGVSRYEYGRDRGSRQPTLRDNQAEVAREEEARLCREHDHCPTHLPSSPPQTLA